LPDIEPITSRPVGLLDYGIEAIAHDVLEDHPLPDDIVAGAALEERLLDAREPAAQQACDGDRR
jgi:hypothetical protein